MGNLDVFWGPIFFFVWRLILRLELYFIWNSLQRSFLHHTSPLEGREISLDVMTRYIKNVFLIVIINSEFLAFYVFFFQFLCFFAARIRLILLCLHRSFDFLVFQQAYLVLYPVLELSWSELGGQMRSLSHFDFCSVKFLDCLS